MILSEDISIQKKRKLPDKWRIASLKDIGTFISGGTPSKENGEYWGGSIPFVTGADITKFYIDSENARAFLTDAGLCSGKTAICQKGTILVVTRTRVGRVGIASEKMCASQDISPYICGPELFPEYACRYLMSISDLLISNCRGATIQGLTRDFIHDLNIPLPPLSDQKRIASILNEQITAVEKARAAAEKQLEAAKSLPDSYLRAVFCNSKTQKWPVKCLGDVSDVVSGITLGRKTNNDLVRAVPYLRVANVKDGYLDLADVYEIYATEKEIDKCRLKYGDLLLTEGGDPDKLGRGTFWQEEIEEAIHQNHIFRVRFDLTKFSPKFIAFQINSLYAKSYFLSHAKQTTGIATINQKVLKGFPLLIPAIEEQNSIAEHLEKRMSQTRALIRATEEQFNILNRLPDALLRNALNGEL